MGCYEGLSSARKGDIAELESAIWLMKNGYEVYRNVAKTGQVDLVTRKQGEITLIDVKADCYDPKLGYRRFKHSRTKSQAKQGIKILRFNPDTKVVRFVKHRLK